ncbi:hypothetical protein B0H21DRAFT_239085 [Amylocystis lapponica]|nr:hypothetical protein B0H21DRAFT_239085 [Amylocystis lapponica]
MTAHSMMRSTTTTSKRIASSSSVPCRAPMDFINAFLPKAHKHPPLGVQIRSSEASDGRRALQTGDSALNGGETGKPQCPGFRFEHTSRAERSSKRSTKPAICCYATKSLKHIPQTKGKYSANPSYAEFFIEVKTTRQQDFFCDPVAGANADRHSFILDHISGENPIEHATGAFGCNFAYAAEACSRQHRLFYFSVCLSGYYARLIRWDRAGAIATRAFNIRSTPELLREFLCVFHMRRTSCEATTLRWNGQRSPRRNASSRLYV